MWPGSGPKFIPVSRSTAVPPGPSPVRRYPVLAGVLEEAVEHEGAVGGERQLGERAGEAAARLDGGHQRPRREVEALQRPFPEQP